MLRRVCCMIGSSRKLLTNGTTEPLGASQSNWTGSKANSDGKHGRSVIEAIKCICRRLSIRLSDRANMRGQTRKPRFQQGNIDYVDAVCAASVRMHNRRAVVLSWEMPSIIFAPWRALRTRKVRRSSQTNPGMLRDPSSAACRTCYLHTPAL